MSKHKGQQGRGHGHGKGQQPSIGPRQHLKAPGQPVESTNVGLADEGQTPMQHKGEVRGDQTRGHHGGSKRQTQNRGRG